MSLSSNITWSVRTVSRGCSVLLSLPGHFTHMASCIVSSHLTLTSISVDIPIPTLAPSLLTSHPYRPPIDTSSLPPAVDTSPLPHLVTPHSTPPFRWQVGCTIRWRWAAPQSRRPASGARCLASRCSGCCSARRGDAARPGRPRAPAATVNVTGRASRSSGDIQLFTVLGRAREWSVSC